MNRNTGLVIRRGKRDRASARSSFSGLVWRYNSLTNPGFALAAPTGFEPAFPA